MLWKYKYIFLSYSTNLLFYFSIFYYNLVFFTFIVAVLQTFPTKDSILFKSILFYLDTPHPHLFLSIAVVQHAMLGCHGIRVVQRGSVKWHLGNPGNAVSNVGHAMTHRLVLVTPVLEELFEEGRLTHLRQDLHLGLFGVIHLLDKLLCRLHGHLTLVQVGIFALQMKTSSSLSIIRQ